MTLIHVLGLYGWWWSIWYAKWQTMVWAYVIANLGGIGVLVGAHRLWTHRSFKARWPLRVVLMIAQTIALQNDIYEWVRDHRVHHKYSETDADPHNSRRGFFFAHVGWLLCRKHPDVKRKGAGIDMSDVWADPIVRFQRRFYIPLVLFFWGIFPISVPVYFWGENLYPMIIGNFFRYTISLHHAWLVNSAAHIYGYQFFDRTLRPRENYMVTYLSLGEGYHNYHHTFPWDYSASEHGWKKCFNVATLFIDLMAWFGLAYDRRIVSREVIEQRAKRTGDLSIIPPLMNEKRQPVSVILDFISGMLVSSWILWVTFILSYFLRT
ncbi:Acyl-CoA desaturase [Sarcoptes scabiei]|uniref:Acyl-CoA desaturase n=1 Tax=Sarcoptes scabiei TaxID=52283 RepID=A0A834VHB3_SARSC|nr:Acyl-CoA desaturase [Sarcoptes scabiei]